MSQSSVDFTEKGPIVPDTATVRDAIESEWQAAFGNTLNPDPATPQGQLITSETAIVQDKNSQLLFLANMFNPDVSSGIWQDALGRIYFIDRKPALPTVVQCVCTGLPGTVISGLDGAGDPVVVEDINGYRYRCQTGGVIPRAGSVTLPFENLETGPLECPALAVTRIVTVIPGWDTVLNPQPGATGQDVETRLAFELRRRESVALNGNGSVGAIYANVFDVEGVIDCIVAENTADIPKLIGNVSLSPHSVYVSVVGGADLDIARAIASRKSAGCDMNGNTSYELKDEITGARQTITWERPETIRFGVQVIIVVKDTTPDDIEDRIKDAVVSNFDVGDTCTSTDRVRMGDTVYASRFYSGIIAAGVSDLVSVRLAAPYSGQQETVWVESVGLEINQFPTLSRDDVLVLSRE